MAVIIDGTAVSKTIKDEVKTEVFKLASGGKTPSLAVVIVGGDPASLVYVGAKKKACEYTGIKSISHELPENVSESELLELVEKLNKDKDVSGILVQLPLPSHIDEENVLLAIDPCKDVDGFHPMNVGLLNIGKAGLVSCTPAGIIELIKRGVGGDVISGSNCVVIGRSNIVGKPVSSLLLKENGTVTICHSKTKDLSEITKKADILIAALGKPKFVTGDMVKQGAVVIDVGVHRLEGKKLCGDVDFESCFETSGHITPVPGGVGPMTIAMLMKNCLTAFKEQSN